MYRFIIMIGCLFCSSQVLKAGEGDFAVSKIPASLLKNANAVMRIDEQRFEIINSGKYVEKNRYAVTILNEKGDHWAAFSEYYDRYRKIQSIEGYLYDAQGKQIGKMKTKDAVDLSGPGGASLIDDNRMKEFSFGHRIYPYTVEFVTEVETSNTLFFPPWYSQTGELISVEKSWIEVTSPLDYVYRYKAFNYPGEPQSETRGKVRVTTWKMENIPAFKKEPFSPMLHEIVTMVIFGPTSFRVDDYTGDMSSWKEFGKFVNALKKNRDALPDDVRKKVHELADHLPDLPSKISVLYQFMQKNTRYIGIQLGIGGWQPFDAKYVAAKAYGDCKALTNYMYSLLKEAGITSYYSLVNSGRGQTYITTDFPSQQFDHVILCVPIQNDTTWLECTSQSSPAGYMGDFTNDRPALLINDDGGQLVMTKRYPPTDNRQERRITALLNEDATLKLNSHTRFSGLQLDRVHQVINSLTKDKIKEYLQHEIDLPTYEVTTFSYSENKSLDPVIREDLEIAVANYASFTGKRLFIVPNIMNRSPSRLINDEERKMDIVLPSGFLDVDSVQITVPGGFTAESIPADVNLATPFGDYETSCRMTGNTITYYRRFLFKGGRFPAKSYPDLVKFFDQVYKSDRSRLVLVRPQ